MLNYGFIGIGQVGGLFAETAKAFGYASLALNTAKLDLNMLEKLNKSEKIHLSGYQGAGKDRSIGSEAFEQHFDVIIEKVNEKFQQCQIIFPVFALGGGTGSGMGPKIVHLLTECFKDKVISPVLFMPDQNESPRAKMNALESFSEISENEDIGAVFAIDNENVLRQHNGESLKTKYEKSRKEFMHLLHRLNQKTEKQSMVNNLDEMDLLTVFSERGSAVLSWMRFSEEHVSDMKLMSERLLKSWKLSNFAGVVPQSVARAAVVCEMPEKLTEKLTIESVFDGIARPLEVFHAVYESEDPTLLLLATGLSFPNDLLEEYEDHIQSVEKSIFDNIVKARKQTFETKNNWTSSLKRERKVKI